MGIVASIIILLGMAGLVYVLAWQYGYSDDGMGTGADVLAVTLVCTCFFGPLSILIFVGGEDVFFCVWPLLSFLLFCIVAPASHAGYTTMLKQK